MGETYLGWLMGKGRMLYSYCMDSIHSLSLYVFDVQVMIMLLSVNILMEFIRYNDIAGSKRKVSSKTFIM